MSDFVRPNFLWWFQQFIFMRVCDWDLWTCECLNSQASQDWTIDQYWPIQMLKAIWHFWLTKLRIGHIYLYKEYENQLAKWHYKEGQTLKKVILHVLHTNIVHPLYRFYCWSPHHSFQSKPKIKSQVPFWFVGIVANLNVMKGRVPRLIFFKEDQVWHLGQVSTLVWRAIVQCQTP